MTARRLSRIQSVLAVTFSLLAVTLPTHAQSLQDVSKLLKQGQQTQALDQVDKYLATRPKDAQGRFVKGVILTEMGRNQDAVGVFTKLTEDYPELPEPYNNLAVIYAQQKQYDKAKQALEMAIRTHPAYATAHENLGDVYARMASQAYDKALQLDSSNATAQTKLAMIRELISIAPRDAHPLPGGTSPVVAPKPVAPSSLPPVASAPVVPPAAVPQTKSPGSAVSQPAPIAKPAEQKPAPVEEPKAKPAGNEDEIAKAVDAWASAWSRKDVKDYLAFYAKDFHTPGGVSRVAWENERRNRVGKPGAIQVDVENLRVSFENADHATVRFRQHYKSASLKTSSNKALEMVRRGNKWQIQQERVGN